MNVEEYFKKGLLIIEQASTEKAQKSLEISLHKLENAKKLLTHNILDEAVTVAYASAFHASRALLFSRGVREKSHYAIYVYLREKCSQDIERRFINDFNHLRELRHEINYGLERVKLEKKEVKEIIRSVKEYVELIKKLV